MDFSKPVQPEDVGYGKSAAGLLGNVIDMATPSATPGDTSTKGRIYQHVHEAADWLRNGSEPQGYREHVGAIGEQATELLGTEGLMKLVGEAPAVAKGLKGAAAVAENLKATNTTLKALAENKFMTGLVMLGLRASKDAALQGGQTYLHTEDPEQARHAAEVGAAFRAGGEAAGAVLSKGLQIARRVGPQTIDIAGKPVRTLASQLNENRVPIETGATGKIGRAQQLAGPQVMQSMAQSATRKALERINATRVFEQNPARLLTAGEDAQPQIFTLEGPGTTEAQEGPLTQEPRKKQIGTRVVERGTGAEGANIRDINPETGQGPAITGQPATSARKLVKEPTFQYMSGTRPGSPEARSDVVTGGGTLQMDDPTDAEAKLHQLKRAEQDPGYDKLSQDQKDNIQAQRTSLEDQLKMHYAGTTRHMPVDVDRAVGHVLDFGEGSNQIEAALKPVFAKYDSATTGELSDLMRQYDRAKNNAVHATAEGLDQAQDEMKDADDKINNILTRYGGSPNIRREEYQAARAGWWHKSTMDQLDVMAQRTMNSARAREVVENGRTQFMRSGLPHAKNFENFLSKGNNRARVAELIGDDGIQNWKNITTLMSNEFSGESKNVGAEIAKALFKYTPAAGGIASGLAHVLGISPVEAGLTAEAVTRGTRFVINSALTSPRIGDMFEMAVKNHIDPKIYAPLIARAIMVPQQEQKQPEEGQQ